MKDDNMRWKRQAWWEREAAKRGLVRKKVGEDSGGWSGETKLLRRKG